MSFVVIPVAYVPVQSDNVEALFAQAVEISDADYERSWALLREAAQFGSAAARVAYAEVNSPDANMRAAACDLLGLVSEIHEDVRPEAATLLVSLAETEPDDDVQWSIGRALGATNDPRALPVLIRLAGHADSDVRFVAATALPKVLDDDPDEAGLAALIALCGDPDQEVRNWATFGLGSQTTADGNTVRSVLWELTTDSYSEVREEAVRGLARRRDQRAVSLLADLLAAGTAYVPTFTAAEFLGHESLLPLLREFDPADPGVAQALAACDPVHRAEKDALAFNLFDAVVEQLPDHEVAMFGSRCELGVELEITDRSSRQTALLSMEALLTGAGNDSRLAAQLAADQLRSANR